MDNQTKVLTQINVRGQTRSWTRVNETRNQTQIKIKYKKKEKQNETPSKPKTKS
jgi:hypothetical protein